MAGGLTKGARAKLRAGPIRRGRAAGSAEARQLQDEVVAGQAVLRDAILELGVSASFATAYDAAGSSAELYVPWGGAVPGSFGSPTALHALHEPFDGARLTRVDITSTADPGQLRVRIYDLDGGQRFDSGLLPAEPDATVTVEPDVGWSSLPLVISIAGASPLTEVAVLATCMEAP